MFGTIIAERISASYNGRRGFAKNGSRGVDVAKAEQVRGMLLVIAAGCCWGTSGTLQSFAPEGATPLTVGAVRAFGTGVVLLSVLLAMRGRAFFQGPWRIRPILLAGFGVAVYQLLFFASVRSIGAGIAAILALGSAPAMAGTMGRLVFGEKLGFWWYISTALTVCGGILLVSGGGVVAERIDPMGVLLALAAGFAFSLEGVGIKLSGDTRTPFETITAVFVAAGVMVLPFLATPDAAWVFSPRGLLVTLALTTFSSALGFTLFTKGLLVVGVAKSYTLSLSEPLTACLLSTFVLGQVLAPRALVGVGVICVGIALLARDIGKDSAAAEAVLREPAGERQAR